MKKILEIGFVKKILENPLVKKFLNREIITYIICGGLTTLVNLIAYRISYIFVDIMIANIIAWIASVLFAYVVNKIFVFQSKTRKVNALIKELVGFFGGRIGTLLIESLILYVFIKTLGFHEMVVKLAAQIVVLILNFVISKLFVFKKKED